MSQPHFEKSQVRPVQGKDSALRYDYLAPRSMRQCPLGRITPYFLIVILFPMLLNACTLARQPSNWMEQRTALEQLLFSQALNQSAQYLALPLPPGAPIVIEAVAPSPPPLVNMLRDTYSNRLGALGLRIRKDEKQAGYLIRVVAETLGTEQGLDLLGLPSLQSALLPIASPEIALYRNEYIKAMVRVSLEVYDIQTGQHILSTPFYEGTKYFNQYIIAIFLGFRLTDAEIPK
jgi:hypothetical protein